MGTKEIEAVRAFCRAAQGLAGEAWKCDTDAAIGRVIRHMWSKSDLEVRSMIEVGRVIAKLDRGMSSTAIATPSGPVLVEWQADGGFVVTMAATTTIKRSDAYNPAVVLYEALVAAGGPTTDEPEPSTLTVEEADAMAGEIITRLREGRDLGDLPDCGITIEETQHEWRVIKDDKTVAVPTNAVDSWGRLRTEIARLLRE